MRPEVEVEDYCYMCLLSLERVYLEEISTSSQIAANH